jgi:hypothetical protein
LYTPFKLVIASLPGYDRTLGHEHSPPLDECRVGQERSQEGDVGLDATDPELDLIFELAKPPTPQSQKRTLTDAFSSSFWK